MQPLREAKAEKMNGPSIEFRQAVVERLANISEISDSEAEQVVLDTLDMIGEEIIRDLQYQEFPGSPDAAYDQLGAVDAWASVISTPLARAYAPTSPWRRKVAGWAKTVGSKLQWLVNLLLAPLRAAQAALGASGCDISVSFPWGVSVGLSW
jgi:hypothetical protein